MGLAVHQTPYQEQHIYIFVCALVDKVTGAIHCHAPHLVRHHQQGHFGHQGGKGQGVLLNSVLFCCQGAAHFLELDRSRRSQVSQCCLSINMLAGSQWYQGLLG